MKRDKEFIMKKSRRMAAMSFASMLTAGLALPAGAATTQLPPEQTRGSVSYVSGGVGSDAAQRFEAAAPHYPLVVQLFEHASPHAVYTAQADVKITDLDGHVLLNQKSEGPFMLVRLPAGEYHVSASLNGHHMTARTVQVADGGHAKATFVFPAGTG
ncbi:MAG TPA: carboxypeptidase regulatory-like domain-containing protein [Burkholderiaceae bacterium]|nr:carboxypeptidase regulatory-like domain-containing protein [Burkholderiaceae bacterium]